MKKSIKNSERTASGMRPARTPEARENQMIALATDLAEQQLRDGTASAQVISHYLKLGSTKEKLERQRLEKEVELITAKTESIQSAKRSEELFEKAVEAMKSYRGEQEDDLNEEY